MGFAHVSYPASLMFRITATMAATLAQLRRHADGGVPMPQDPAAADARQQLDDALELARWQRIEREFGAPPPAEDAR